MSRAISGEVAGLVDEPNRLARGKAADVVCADNVGQLERNGAVGAQPGDWVLTRVG